MPLQTSQLSSVCVVGGIQLWGSCSCSQSQMVSGNELISGFFTHVSGPSLERLQLPCSLQLGLLVV